MLQMAYVCRLQTCWLPLLLVGRTVLSAHALGTILHGTSCWEWQAQGAHSTATGQVLKAAGEVMAGWAFKCKDSRWHLTTELATQQLSEQEQVRQ